VESENKEIAEKNKQEAEESARIEAERLRQLEEQRKKELEEQSMNLGVPRGEMDWSEDVEDKFGYEEYKRATERRRAKVQPKKLTKEEAPETKVSVDEAKAPETEISAVEPERDAGSAKEKTAKKSDSSEKADSDDK
jgi:hypothetical protein